MCKTAALFASLALAAAVAPAAAAQAPSAEPKPNWELLNSPTDFMVHWWDRASLVRDGDFIRIVVRAKPRIVSPGPGYVDFLTEIRCADRKWRIVRTTNYGMNGEPLVDNDPNAKFRKIDSPPFEKLRGAVC